MKNFLLGALFAVGVVCSMGANIDRSKMQMARASVKALAGKIRAGNATPAEKDRLLTELAYIVVGEE